MNVLAKLALASILTISSGASIASEDAVTMLNEITHEDIREALEQAGEIQAVANFPATKFIFVQTETKTFLVSENGRFVIEGDVLDAWNRRVIQSVADVHAAARVPLANYGLNFKEEFKAISIGNRAAPVDAIAFIDPTSEHTSTLVERTLQYERETHLLLIMLPLLGGESAVRTGRALICMEDGDTRLELLLSRDFDDQLEKFGDSACGSEEIQLANAMRPILGVDGLPFLIRTDGLTMRGAPEDIKTWLLKP